MTEYVEKERFEGVWRGEEVRPARVWRGHRFSDDEVDKLLADETIIIDGLVSAKGNTYGVYGKLARMTFTNNDGKVVEFVGFEQLGFAPSDNGVPNSWSGHTFTADEKEHLERGESIFVSDCTSKKTGKRFSCTLRWTEDDQGIKRITPEFDKR